MEERKEGTLELKDTTKPPYDAVIPIESTKYLSYGLDLTDLQEIKAFPTRLESTSQVLAYGHDMFFTRVSPENNFDLLQENFNYTMLFLFIAGLAATTYMVKRHVTSKAKRTQFLLAWFLNSNFIS